ncbi:alginate lyase family protein [Xanthobacteraceae bacterium Astr-EGSB]|uniref:alginate lyase family protein n=1 Tax=Astrobacterium formosum TaxID=3069710 RepID=UPI0027B13E07|nr:alginate lyase family protein [Xanthobacteraceae bacterium Astr-EGSB]
MVSGRSGRLAVALGRALSVAAMVWSTASALAADLKGPVDVPARRALVGRPLGPVSCAAVPAPVRDIAAEPFYSDRAGSVVDPARYAARERIVKPLEDYLRGVVKMTDRWIESNPPRPETARCALDWLDGWARADAMLGQVTPQGGYERKWTLGGLALAYLNIREAPGLDAAAKARVEAWFARLAAEVRRYYDRPPGRGVTDKLNNHRYWAALAVAASAVATGDRAGLDWAIEAYRVGIGQVDADGMLPLELARAGKALHYHAFSVTPLVMVAEIGAANGIDLYGERGGALGRLVANVVGGLSDPSPFERRTDTKQGFVGSLSGWHVAWAEIWYARRRDAAVVPLLRTYRPLRNNWLGGNMSLGFGVPELPRP